MRVKNKILSLFWRGFLTLLPLYLTLYLLIWLLENIERTFSQPLRLLLGPYYVPGMGFLFAFLFVILIGFLLQSYITQQLSRMLNRFITRLPVIGEIYESIQVMLKYLTAPAKPTGEEVVMIHFKEMNLSLLAIVTRTNFDKAPAGIADDSLISVYIPMSYQIGGFTVYVPRSCVTKVDLSQKEALKWAFIGGIGK